MEPITRHAVTVTRAAALLAIAATTACSTVGPSRPARVYEQESFASRDAFSREFVASPQDTCNAARRALLSQGYMLTAAEDTQMDARKRFQPSAESHVQIDFRVVCSPAARGQPTSVAFVSATQEHYQIKKNPMAASVGVSPFGSISLPLASATDSLVRVGAETIPSGRFYDRFFDLVEQFLAEQKGLEGPVDEDPRGTGPALPPSGAARPR